MFSLARQLGLSEPQQDSPEIPHLTCFSGKQMVEGNMRGQLALLPLLNQIQAQNHRGNGTQTLPPHTAQAWWPHTVAINQAIHNLSKHLYSSDCEAQSLSSLQPSQQ